MPCNDLLNVVCWGSCKVENFHILEEAVPYYAYYGFTDFSKDFTT
ncbi:Uncharacterized protein BM_BM14209 [Brugia malayi]|uniref:Bm14209 n=1 Tax=Brugia malayi TaxID=6279 RepID=A0A0J9XW00_BRUMA|nr:Uncharacterized protein BM_BM14209 [Brugia malayi]CDP96236.1 Bm14209 [Brugia malayi]VIO98493.1 Uncharacterized protein BM_BM14209 [Brugia malayi]